MRRIPALLGAAAIVAATLAGCTALPADGCTPPYKSGDASSIVTAPGKVGTAPTVDFPTPLISKGTQISVVKPGKGEPIVDGQVDYEQGLYLGSTGEQLTATGYDGTSFARSGTGIKGEAIGEALQCSRVGERLVLTTTAKAALTADQLSQSGMADDDTLVIVLDVLARYLGKANGVNQLPLDGMPTVVTAPDGTPGIQLPEGGVPDKTRISTIKAGGGATVKKGDTVVVNFSSWIWPTTDGAEPSSFIETWSKHQATNFDLSAQGSLPSALVDSLVGEKVGGQVLLVMSPGKGSFAADSLPTGLTATDTVIFVIDILGTTK
ncbi:FKBP-type peptidyl-prolyl cis-trans isomerase [soil metagenome]